MRRKMVRPWKMQLLYESGPRGDRPRGYSAEVEFTLAQIARGGRRRGFWWWKFMEVVIYREVARKHGVEIRGRGWKRLD
ncbi:hypothetical protein AVEN_162449-1 [Araneus ventricosus]|uniref:Uncharacterized protein n=1 Tax=Araneus ventricosus TaxID=182803 RepID=A0A4Y2REN0_ARAVE|nr:hypothetical protein AVEN_162449-1 [Araneus ventricosus]